MVRNSGYSVTLESYPAAVRAKLNRARITHAHSPKQNQKENIEKKRKKEKQKKERERERERNFPISLWIFYAFLSVFN